MGFDCQELNGCKGSWEGRWIKETTLLSFKYDRWLESDLGAEVQVTNAFDKWGIGFLVGEGGVSNYFQYCWS